MELGLLEKSSCGYDRYGRVMSHPPQTDAVMAAGQRRGSGTARVVRLHGVMQFHTPRQSWWFLLQFQVPVQMNYVYKKRALWGPADCTLNQEVVVVDPVVLTRTPDQTCFVKG